MSNRETRKTRKTRETRVTRETRETKRTSIERTGGGLPYQPKASNFQTSAADWCDTRERGDERNEIVLDDTADLWRLPIK